MFVITTFYFKHILILWEEYNTHIRKTFICNKKAIRVIFGLAPWEQRESCFTKLGFLTVPALHFYELVIYISNIDYQ